MKRLSEKQSDFLWMINDLLNRFREFLSLGNYQLKITSLYRTVREQEELRKNGFSWISQSKHLSGLAVDFALILENQFVVDSDAYEKMGMYWESIGGAWGGNWKIKDVYHFEYNEKARGAYLDTIQKQEI